MPYIYIVQLAQKVPSTLNLLSSSWLIVNVSSLTAGVEDRGDLEQTSLFLFTNIPDTPAAYFITICREILVVVIIRALDEVFFGFLECFFWRL